MLVVDPSGVKALAVAEEQWAAKEDGEEGHSDVRSSHAWTQPVAEKISGLRPRGGGRDCLQDGRRDVQICQVQKGHLSQAPGLVVELLQSW